jgi:hypothetical protein
MVSVLKNEVKEVKLLLSAINAGFADVDQRLEQHEQFFTELRHKKGQEI